MGSSMGGSYVVARVHSQWGVHPLGVARVAELFGCVVRARVDSGTCLGACVWNVVDIYAHEGILFAKPICKIYSLRGAFAFFVYSLRCNL